MSRVPRSQQRREIEGIYRVQLMENDLDEFEEKFEETVREIGGRYEKRLDAIDARQAKILWALVGLLISVTTTAVGLVLTGLVSP